MINRKANGVLQNKNRPAIKTLRSGNRVNNAARNKLIFQFFLGGASLSFIWS
jgi:hypothetical protein